MLHGPVSKQAVALGGPRVRYAADDASPDVQHNRSGLTGTSSLHVDHSLASPAIAVDRSLAAPPVLASKFTVTSLDIRSDGETYSANEGGAESDEEGQSSAWTEEQVCHAALSSPHEHMYTQPNPTINLIPWQVTRLRAEQKQKVESLMRSIHKLQEKVKELRRADKENRRSRHIMTLQQTVAEQEAVIRQMIRDLASLGYSDGQFQATFAGKKTLRELNLSEGKLRAAAKAQDEAERRLATVERRYEGTKGTREELATRYEGKLLEWQQRAVQAEDKMKELQALSTDAAVTRARCVELERTLEEHREHHEQMRAELASSRIVQQEQLQTLEDYTRLVEQHEESLATSVQKQKQLKAALKEQQRIIELQAVVHPGTIALDHSLQAPHGALLVHANDSSSLSALAKPPPPHAGGGEWVRQPGAGPTILIEEHEVELRRLRRQMMEEAEEADAAARRKARQGERQWEERLETRSALRPGPSPVLPYPSSAPRAECVVKYKVG
jgi:hypothetical protein